MWKTHPLSPLIQLVDNVKVAFDILSEGDSKRLGIDVKKVDFKIVAYPGPTSADLGPFSVDEARYDNNYYAAVFWDDKLKPFITAKPDKSAATLSDALSNLLETSQVVLKIALAKAGSICTKKDRELRPAVFLDKDKPKSGAAYEGGHYDAHPMAKVAIGKSAGSSK